MIFLLWGHGLLSFITSATYYGTVGGIGIVYFNALTDIFVYFLDGRGGFYCRAFVVNTALDITTC